jgi:hypothetical protein
MFDGDGFQDRDEEEEEGNEEDEEGRKGGNSQREVVDPEVEAVLAERRSSKLFKQQIQVARTTGNLSAADKARAILRAHVQEEERQQRGRGGGGRSGSLVRKKASPPVLITTGKGRQIKHIISTNSSTSYFSSSPSVPAPARASPAAPAAPAGPAALSVAVSAPAGGSSAGKKSKKEEGLETLARFEAMDEEDEEWGEELGVGKLRRRKVIREIFTLSTQGMREEKMLERVLQSIKEEEGAWWMGSRTKAQYQQYVRERMTGLYD